MKFRKERWRKDLKENCKEFFFLSIFTRFCDEMLFMKISILSLLILISLSFQSGCTYSEVSKKTKSAIESSAYFLKNSGKTAYKSSKRVLGFEEDVSKTLKPMSVSKRKFDVLPDGTQVNIYVMTNANGMQVSLLDYGGTVKEIRVPDRNGDFANVSLGFSKIIDYVEKSPYFGCITGRYANRIAAGKFSLDGEVYQLATNNDPNHLHGGVKGFDKQFEKMRMGDGEFGVRAYLKGYKNISNPNAYRKHSSNFFYEIITIINETI